MRQPRAIEFEVADASGDLTEVAMVRQLLSWRSGEGHDMGLVEAPALPS